MSAGASMGGDRGVSTAASVSPDSGTHWTAEGAWPVAPGVWRIPLPLPMDGLKAVNVYVLETDQGLTLIDGGWAVEVSRTLLEKSLASVGFGVRDIRRFLVTHVHRDHYTQAVAVRNEFGAETGVTVSLGIGDKPNIDLMQDIVDGKVTEDPFAVQLTLAGAGHIAEQWRAMHTGQQPDPLLKELPDVWLEADHAIDVGSRTIDAISTPGHTQGHFVFAEKQAGLLFAGDHVLPTITPSIGFEMEPGSLPLGDFLSSLGKVRALPDLQLLPAHGPITSSSHARVDELLVHHEARLKACLAGIGSAGSTAVDVAKTLGWTRHEHSFDSLDIFNGSLASLETRAHMELLVARGDATVTDVDGVRIYRTPA